MKRSKFSLSHYKLLTCDMGELVPISCFDVLPGDTVQQASSLLVRVSPLLAPVMHPVQVRVHHWFVPYRILWDDWEDFITGGPDGMDNSVVPYFLKDTNPIYNEGGLFDYLGVPPNLTAGVGISAFPVRAYNLIWNEWYRDQDLQNPLSLSTAGGQDTTSTMLLQKVAWEKDYFTSSRPWTQKGPEVTVPMGTFAPVVTTSVNPVWSPVGGTPDTALRAIRDADVPLAIMGGGTFPGAGQDVGFTWGNPTGLQADLANASAANINELRTAFALQRYAEARARYGSRYTEYLRYLGVRSSDARLQRPEYLGGGKQTIQFSEVLQTGPSATDGGASVGGVADLKGHGIGALRSNRYRRFFEEHGVVLSLLHVKPKTMYASAFPRMWSRQTKEDFFQKELQHVGQQEVFNREVHAAHTVPGGVFGYQDRYDEYRRMESSIAGNFRTTLDHWHYARIFASDVTLNSAFVTCDATKRVNAEQTEDCLWVMANHSIQARRLVAGRANSFIS